VRFESCIFFNLLVLKLSIARNSSPKTKFEAGLDKAPFKYLRAEDDRGLVSRYLDLIHRHFELVLKELLQMRIGNVITDFVEDD
jgi:hypothetical protein